MKHFFLSLILLLSAFALYAQEKALEEYERPEEFFSDTSKYIWLAFIFAFSIFLVARTFRNKPEA